MIPGDLMRAMGGAMELVASGSKEVDLMRHIAQNRKGKTYFKLVKECNLPVTGRGIVSKVIT
jgi:3-oxoacid CoA-transferase subunit B